MTMTVKSSTLTAAGPDRPRLVPPPADPFADLPPHLHEQMRTIITRLVDAELPLEFDPVLPHTVGTAIDGRLFRVAVVSDKQGQPQRVAILGPDLREWDTDMLFALIPEVRGEPDRPTMRLSPLPPPRRHQTEVLEEILAELKAIRGCLAPFSS